MLRQRNRNPFSQKICTLAAFYLAVSSIFPPIRAFPGYNLTCVMAMLAWIVCAFLSNPTFFTIFAKKPLHRQVVLVFVVYTLITPYLFGNGVIGNRYMAYGQVLIFYFIYQYNRTYGYDSSSRAIIKWSLPFIIITSAITLYGLISNPYLSRSIKSSGEYTAMMQSQGIGGYELIYFLVFLVVISWFLIINIKSLNLQFRYRMLIYTLFTLAGLTVIYSNYFTALIMVIASLLIISLTRTRIVNRIFIFIAGIFILVQGKAVLLSVVNWFANHLSRGNTLDRVLLLQQDLLGNGNESLLAIRMPTLETSWDAFWDNPFFGIVPKPIESDGGYLIGFGQHSHFLDTFALYGMFIGLVGIFIIVHPFLKRVKGAPALLGLNLAVFAAVLILFTMNNVTPSIGYAIFFIYPLLYDWQADRVKAKVLNEEIGVKTIGSIAS